MTEKIEIEQKVYREVVHIICDEQMIPGGRAERIDKVYKQAGYRLPSTDREARLKVMGKDKKKMVMPDYGAWFLDSEQCKLYQLIDKACEMQRDFDIQQLEGRIEWRE